MTKKSYYTALSKQAHSYNELLFISAQVIAFMVKAQAARAEIKSKFSGHYNSQTPITTTDNLTNVLNSTLRDITKKPNTY